jgi:hypothetical protein
MIKRWKLVAGLAAILAIIPIPYTASPKWRVLVVDQSGNPAPDILVRLEFENYFVEDSGHEEDQRTDADGRVTFPRHQRSASLLRRFFYTAQDVASFVHAGFGPHATVFAFGEGVEGEATEGDIVTDWTGAPNEMESRIILRTMKN